MGRRSRGPRSACGRSAVAAPSSGCAPGKDLPFLVTTTSDGSSMDCTFDADSSSSMSSSSMGGAVGQTSLQREHLMRRRSEDCDRLQGARDAASCETRLPYTCGGRLAPPRGQMLPTPEESAADVVSTAASSFTSLPPLSPSKQARKQIEWKRRVPSSRRTDVPVDDMTAEAPQPRSNLLRHRRNSTSREKDSLKDDVALGDSTSASGRRATGWSAPDTRRADFPRTKRALFFSCTVAVLQGLRLVVRFFYRVGAHPLLGWGLLCFLLIQEQQLQSMYRRGCVELEALNVACGHISKPKAAAGMHLASQPQGFSPRRAMGAGDSSQVASRHDAIRLPQGVLQGEVQAQCAYMMILSVAGGLFVILAVLCHTAAVLCRVCRSEHPTTEGERNSRARSDRVKDSVAGTSPTPVDSAGELPGKPQISHGCKGGDLYPARSSDERLSDDVWTCAPNSPTEEPHCRDQGMQTDHLPQLAGVDAERVLRCMQRGLAPGRDKTASLCLVEVKDNKDDSTGVCTPRVEAEQCPGSHEPETFYIGDDDAESSVAVIGCSSEEVLCFSKGGSVNSLMW